MVYKTISVTETTKHYLDTIKLNKGFKSLDELILACVKACKTMTRPMILYMAIDTKFGRTPEEAAQKLREKEKTVEEVISKGVKKL